MNVKHLTGRHDQGNHGHGNGLGVPLVPDKIPGDKLKLAGRIHLEPGERLAASGLAKQSGQSDVAMPVAVVVTPSGPQVRLGVDPGDAEGGSSEDEDDDAGGWSGNNPATTVRLDPAGVEQLRDAVAQANAKAKARQKEIRADWARMEDLEGDDDPAAVAELAGLNAKHPPGSTDDTFVTGFINGQPGGGDLAYEVRGEDDGEGGWEFVFAVRPPDAGAEWTMAAATEDHYLAGHMEPKHVAAYQKQIASMVAAASAKLTPEGGAMQTKRFQPTIKALDEQGAVSFVVATLNDIDKDGDVTLPGYFGEQHTVMVPVHDWNHVPIGKGRIYEQGDEAIAEVKLNLAIPAAKDWHEALKFDFENQPALQEYSYGFTVLEGGSEFGEYKGRRVRFLKARPDGTPGVKVHEVSPVLVGAGNGTRTLGVKRAPTKFADEAQAVLTAVRALSDRAAEVLTMRQQEGKALGAASVDLLTQVEAELKRLSALLAPMPAAEPDTTQAELEREFLRFAARPAR